MITPVLNALKRHAWIALVAVTAVAPVHSAIAAAPDDSYVPWCSPIDDGNPYRADVLKRVTWLIATPLQKYQAQAVSDTWGYRFAAESADFLARASHLDLPEGTADQARAHASELLDWVISSEDSNGRWWNDAAHKKGDGNVNRFVLGAALEALYYLSYDSNSKFVKDKRVDSLQRAVALQKMLYNGGTEKGWPSQFAGNYVNQDVYYVLITGLWAKLTGDAGFDQQRHHFVETMRQNMLPDGAWHYVASDVESPVYHDLNTSQLARYYCVTHDPQALEQLSSSAKYWKLVMSPQADIEYWSDLWWKQSWQLPTRALLEAAVQASKDPQLYALDKALASRPGLPEPAGMELMTAYEWWRPGSPAATPASGNQFQADQNIVGYRYSNGSVNLGLMVGGGLRDTFVGGVISDSGQAPYTQGVIRAVNISLPGSDGKNLWLSQPHDEGRVQGEGGRPKVCVSYSPQPDMTDGYPLPQIKSKEWNVHQLWVISGGSLAGSLTAAPSGAAMAPKGGAAVIRIYFGPGDIKNLGNGLFQSGDFKVLVSGVDFNSAQISQAATSPTGVPKWPLLTLPLLPDSSGKYASGIWIGTQTAPEVLRPSSSNTGASLEWSSNGNTTKDSCP